jgi:hypothetical protein
MDHRCDGCKLAQEIQAKVDRELNSQPKLSLWEALKTCWKMVEGESVG